MCMCPGEGNGNLLQYSCLGSPMDRGAWRATVHEVVRVRHNSVAKPPPPPPCVYINTEKMINLVLAISKLTFH